MQNTFLDFYTRPIQIVNVCVRVFVSATHVNLSTSLWVVFVLSIPLIPTLVTLLLLVLPSLPSLISWVYVFFTCFVQKAYLSYDALRFNARPDTSHFCTALLAEHTKFNKMLLDSFFLPFFSSPFYLHLLNLAFAETETVAVCLSVWMKVVNTRLHLLAQISLSHESVKMFCRVIFFCSFLPFL